MFNEKTKQLLLNILKVVRKAYPDIRFMITISEHTITLLYDNYSQSSDFCFNLLDLIEEVCEGHEEDEWFNSFSFSPDILNEIKDNVDIIYTTDNLVEEHHTDSSIVYTFERKIYYTK